MLVDTYNWKFWCSKLFLCHLRNRRLGGRRFFQKFNIFLQILILILSYGFRIELRSRVGFSSGRGVELFQPEICTREGWTDYLILRVQGIGESYSTTICQETSVDLLFTVVLIPSTKLNTQSNLKFLNKNVVMVVSFFTLWVTLKWLKQK